MMTYKFSENEIEMLNKYRDQQNNIRLKVRFIALLMIADGTDITSVASITGKTVNTINNWLRQYISEGIDSMNSYDYKPKKPYLDFFQINHIVIYVTFEHPENLKQIKEYIKEKFGVDYTLEAVRLMLKKRGLSVIRPKVHPGSPPSLEQQQAFIDKYNEQKQTDPPGSVRLFMDAMHLHHQNIPGRCWGDPKFVPVMDTDTGRNRLNILGAYNPETHLFLHLTGEENCNADRVIRFLKNIGTVYSYAPKITVYSDNAKYFYAKKVNEWLADNPKIIINYLPCYAPNLNLIERFWKYAKDKLVKSKYYKEYKMFRAKVFQFLNNVGDHIEKLKTLMAERFQIVHA
jgi:transposase